MLDPLSQMSSLLCLILQKSLTIVQKYDPPRQLRLFLEQRRVDTKPSRVLGLMVS